MPFWTYMLHCRGGAFYVGHTDDLERRIAQHRTGATPGFAHDHLPIELVWSETFSTRDEALAMERRVKGWSRARKLALILGDWDAIGRLSSSAEKGSPSTGSGRAEVSRSASPDPAPYRCPTRSLSATVLAQGYAGDDHAERHRRSRRRPPHSPAPSRSP